MPDETHDTTTDQTPPDAPEEQTSTTDAPAAQAEANASGTASSKGHAGKRKGTAKGTHSSPKPGAHFGRHGAHHASQEEVTRVKVAHLEEKRDAGTAAMAKLFEMVDTMQGWMVGGGESGQAGSSAYWEGIAADRFREVFLAEMGALRQDLEELGGFTRELEYYIGYHQAADAQATQIASGLTDATWVDV